MNGSKSLFTVEKNRFECRSLFSKPDAVAAAAAVTCVYRIVLIAFVGIARVDA